MLSFLAFTSLTANAKAVVGERRVRECESLAAGARKYVVEIHVSLDWLQRNKNSNGRAH